MDSASHNIGPVPELPAISLWRMVCLVDLAILVCLIFPTLCENHLSPVSARSCPERFGDFLAVMGLMIASCHKIRYKRCRSSGRLWKNSVAALDFSRLCRPAITGVHLVRCSPSLSSSYTIYLVDAIDLVDLVRVAHPHNQIGSITVFYHRRTFSQLAQ